MATNFNSPQYPVISWQLRISDTRELEVECDGNSTTLDLSGAAYQDLWGFASNGTNGATSESLHGYIASQIQTFLQVDCGFATAVCAATYVWDLPGWPRVRFNVTNTSGNDVDIYGLTDEAGYTIGLDGTSVLTIDASTGGLTDFNSEGYWAPKNLTLYDDRITISPSVFVSTSMDGLTYKTRRWTSERVKRALTFPFVKAPYLWEWRAADPGYYPFADRNGNDLNNVFQRLISAARRNNDNANSTQFRVYNKPQLYRLAIWSVEEKLKDPEDFISDNSDGAQKYFEINLQLEDLGDDGTGSI